MNEAIKLAIEKGGYNGGYDFSGKVLLKTEWVKWCYKPGNHANVAQDTLFWQALGKVLGWGTDYKTLEVIWKRKALEYFDLVLTGGETEKFWKEILTK